MVGWPGGDARREGHAEGPPACADRLMGCPPGSQQALQASSEANGSWARGKTLGTTLLESRVAARLRHAQVALTHSLKRASCVLENKVRESGDGRGGAFCVAGRVLGCWGQLRKRPFCGAAWRRDAGRSLLWKTNVWFGERGYDA